jgi:SAM-dependent methyltransferase
MDELDQQTILSINRNGWDKVAARFYGGLALPQYGPLAQTEDSLALLGQVAGMRVLEIGCGSGHSLAYLAHQGAAELWGIDLSPVQIDLAESLLSEQGLSAMLFAAPMEENPGIPSGYFDLVVSIYALGWSTDLDKTFSLIHSYLKPSGILIFSWEHPAYSGLEYEDGQYVVKRSYHAENPVIHPAWNGVEIVIHERRLSTFINTVIGAGLQIEQLVEPEFEPTLVNDNNHAPERWYSVPRAQLMPTTFIVKARKPPESV